MIGIYHSKDLDGICSGAIIRHKSPDCKLIGYNYGEPFDMNLVVNENVIMADISMPQDKMVAIAKLAKSFVWIDHHKSVIEDFKASDNQDLMLITACLDSSVSACELTWQTLMSSEPPLAVLLLGMYDTWRNENKAYWDNVVMPFQYGMRLHGYTPENFPDHLFTDSKSILDIIKTGQDILTYQASQNRLICEWRAFYGDAFGLPAVFCNGVPHNSQSFESVYDPERHKLMIPFGFDGTHLNFSLYTTHPEVDCSALARKKGGGGHQQAAGFFLEGEQIAEFFKTRTL